MPPSNHPIIPRSGSLGSFSEPPKPPKDKTIYAGFGIGLTLEEYQQVIEAEGYIWTSALRDRVNVLIELIHNNLGIGTTKTQLIHAYEASATGYKGSQDFLSAFNRCEMEYFRAEIQSLRSDYPEWGLPTVLDVLKGINTPKTSVIQNMESAKQRLDNRRLFAADVGPNTFCHRHRALSPRNNLGNSELATYFYGGFMYKAPMPNQEPFRKYGTALATVELENQAASQDTIPRQHTNSSTSAPKSHIGSVASSAQFAATQMGSDPTRQSFASASTAYEHNSMTFLDDNVPDHLDSYLKLPDTTGLNILPQDTFPGEAIDCRSNDRVEHLPITKQTYYSEQGDAISRHMGAPVEFGEYNALQHQIENEDGQYPMQDDTSGPDQGPVKRPRSSNSEEVASENERLKHKINCLKASAGVDKSEIERLNEKIRSLEDGTAVLKSELERSFRVNLEECYKRTIMDLEPRFQSLRLDQQSSSSTRDSEAPRATLAQSDSPEVDPAATDSQGSKRHRNIFKSLRQKSSKKNLRAVKSVPDFNGIRDHVAKPMTSLPVLPAQQHALLTNAHFGGGFYDTSWLRNSAVSNQAIKDFPVDDPME